MSRIIVKIAPDAQQKQTLCDLFTFISTRRNYDLNSEFITDCEFVNNEFFIPSVGLLKPENSSEFSKQIQNRKILGSFKIIKLNNDFFLEFSTQKNISNISEGIVLKVTPKDIEQINDTQTKKKKSPKKKNKPPRVRKPRSALLQPSSVSEFMNKPSDVVSKTEICPVCFGDGGVNAGCYKCEGSGWISTQERLIYNGITESKKASDNTRISNATNYGENIGAHYREENGRIGSNPEHDDYSEDGVA